MTRFGRKHFLTASFVSMSALLLTACGGNTGDAGGAQHSASDSPLQVVTSFTILEDMVEEIGGDRVEVHNMVPTGTDPHEYEPLPDDTKAAAGADLLFMNGLNLEGGSDGWFAKLTDSIGVDEADIVDVSQNVTPMMIGDGEGEREINPHAFIDPAVGIIMAQSIRDALAAKDPEHAEVYEKQAGTYLDTLSDIDIEYDQQLGAIPAEQRVLVTSERAFQYLADHYDLTEFFIWEIDTEENGSAGQLKRLIGELEGVDVPHLIVESNVDTRPMETVSQETGIPIFEHPIYSDEIGDADHPEAGTYVKYLEYNLGVLTDALA